MLFRARSGRRWKGEHHGRGTSYVLHARRRLRLQARHRRAGAGPASREHDPPRSQLSWSGLDAPDDAAVYRIAPDLAIVQTVDFFTPDRRRPVRVGTYRRGQRPLGRLRDGRPPDDGSEPRGLAARARLRPPRGGLDGAGDACNEAGVTIVGGHSIDDPEPKFGLAVTGVVHPDRIVTKTGAAAGSELVLTKPLGMGIVSSGIKEGKTTAETAERAIRIMSTLNRSASEAMIQVGVDAATDVTGFGLVGHLLQMLDGRLDADLDHASVPVLEEAVELAAAGILPGGSRRNRDAGAPSVDPGPLDEARAAVLYDAQTSGGLSDGRSTREGRSPDAGAGRSRGGRSGEDRRSGRWQGEDPGWLRAYGSPGSSPTRWSSIASRVGRTRPAGSSPSRMAPSPRSSA